MFVQRVAGPSRLSAQFSTGHAYSSYRNIGKRHMSRASSGRLSTALVDPRRGKSSPQGIAGLEAMKEQGEQAERMGRRGRERRALDEEDLPTMGQCRLFYNVCYIKMSIQTSIWCYKDHHTPKSYTSLITPKIPSIGPFSLTQTGIRLSAYLLLNGGEMYSGQYSHREVGFFTD